MQHRVLTLPLRAIIVGVFLLFLVFYSASTAAVSAQSSTPAGVVLVPGTVSVGAGQNEAILAALNSAPAIFPHTTYFAITDWRQDGSWAVASVVGLSQLRSNGAWSIDDGNWIGLVLLHQSATGAWHGTLQGTKAFSALIVAAPNSFLNATAKRNLDPLQTSGVQSEATGSYIFPLQPGTLMNYGTLGVHANGFTSVVSGWKAVDMMSDGNTTLNHAPNRLIASETGTISYVCSDGTSVAVKMGDFFYTHLVNNANLVVGYTFNQGDTMGKLKTGSFNKGCGYASQGSNWFHVHWGFPSGSLHIEDWTLSMTTGNWTNGTSTVTPGNWMLAGPTPPAPVNLHATSATQTAINFAWDSSPGADGYHIYSLNAGAYALLDTVPATQTSYMEMRSACGWNQSYKVSAYNYIGDSPRAGPLVAVTIPCDPSPLSPANSSANRWNYDVNFQSSVAPGASGYLFEYWGGPYATPQTCGWSSTASCDVGILPPGNTYSWHVKARSSAGETGWSPTWTFTIQPLPCYTLTVGHTGSGSDPLPNPLNSTSCSTGQYHPTDMISFSSAPDTGWKVGSWSGTNNNSNTAASNTLTMPDGDSTTTVNYTPIVPGVPVLVSPSNGATKQPISLSLSWNAADGAVSYDYCISTSTTCAAWISTGTMLSASISNLDYGMLYYWWARATNTYGNSSVSATWHFTTGSKPGTFSRSSPANGATAQPANTLLQWSASSDAAEYQYCIDTTNDSACQGNNWISTGTSHSADLTGQLAVQTTYYWHVRAINSFGIRTADGGWWAFTTSGMPGAFAKKAPANVAVNIPVRPMLSWSASLYATGYEYCIDQTDDGTCDSNWIRVPARTSTTSSIYLQPLTTYYWQVHALNGFGSASSNRDTWWSFTTGALPASFGKIGPLDSSQDQQRHLTLSWQPSLGATGYQYCLSTTKGACSSWIASGTNTSANVTGLSPHTTYYWQARATNAIGFMPADTAAWWSFTTGYLPASFAKASPVNGAASIALSPTLKWQASAYATTYDYCLSTTATCTAWVNVGNATSTPITGLKAGTLYYWQVRARNSIGTVLASGGPWSFRVGYIPGAFGKSAPSNGLLNQPATLTLSWNTSSGATSYQYCVDTSNNNACQNQNWISSGLTRSVDLSSLELLPNTVYYWQVRAVNSFGIQVANSGVWWSFTTAP